MRWQNNGAGKYRTSRRLRPSSAHFQSMAPQGIMVIIYKSKLKNMQDMKYVRLTIKFNFVLPASVGVS